MNFFSPTSIRRLFTASFAAALLASCGGGEQIESFVPARIITFGDENSLITNDADNTKYTVNGVKFNPTTGLPFDPIRHDCNVNQIWVQQIASSYGIEFAGLCHLDGYSPVGQMRAALNAKSTDFTAQINAFLAVHQFGPKDLVTVMVGIHDVVDAYQTPATAMATVKQAANNVGAEVVRITDLGAKVIVTTIPNVGLMPYARTVGGGNGPTDLSDLSKAFNTALRLKLNEVKNGGRSAGLVLADELLELVIREPAVYGLVNVIDKACTGAIATCNQAQGLVGGVGGAQGAAGGYGATYLWADDLYMSASAHYRIATTAVLRAHNNPF